MEEKTSSSPDLSLHRLEALTDGIFAFAMTLLVLSFNLPGSLKGFDINTLIFSQRDRFFNFFLSFFLLAVFWLINQQMFAHVRKTDYKHLWLNILTLAFVVFIPFSASLVSEFPDNAPSEFFFALNMFLVSVSIEASWIYAIRGRKLIKDEAEEKHLRHRLKRNLVIPFISAAAMVLSFIDPEVCSYLYLLIPFLLTLPLFK